MSVLVSGKLRQSRLCAVLASGLLASCERDRSADCRSENPLLVSLRVLAGDSTESAKEAAQARVARLMPAGSPVDRATKLLGDAGFSVVIISEESTIGPAVRAHRTMTCSSREDHGYSVEFGRTLDGIQSPVTISFTGHSPFAPPSIGPVYKIRN